MKNINIRRISAILCVLLSLCVVMSLCSCKKNNSEDDSTSSGTSYSVDDSSMPEIDDASSAEDASSEESSDEQPSSDASDGGSSTGSSAVQLPTATNPEGEEILGSGTKADPYLELPNIADTHMSVKTISIPAGKSVFYGIQRVAGTILTVENANAYVVYEGKRYDAQGGKVSFEVVAPKALASDNILFEIGNKGGAAATFTLVFTNKTGSRENPTVAAMGKSYNVSLNAEDSTGHYYKYIAEKAGKIRFKVSGTVDSTISVTNNTNSKNLIGNYVSKKLVDPDNGDAVVEYIELEVAKGDEIIINVGTLPNKRGKIVANTITWSASFA